MTAIASLLLLLLLDLIAYQFRDTSPYSSHNVGGEYIGSRYPQYFSGHFVADAVFAATAAVLLLPTILLLRRWPRLATGPMLAAACALPFCLLYSFAANPLLASRYETDAQSITQEGPGWYLPLRYLILAGSSLATAAILLLAVTLVLTSRK